MASSWLMGVDLGGGGVRCLLVEPDSGTELTASRTWQFPTAAGTSGMGCDLDVREMWGRIGEAAREVRERAGIEAGDVAGIATAGVRFGSVLLDAEGHEIFAVPNRDARAIGEGLRLVAEFGEAIVTDTGLWPLPIHATPRLQWLAANRPDVLARATHYLSVSDWLNFRLCGARVTDPTQAGCTGLFDLTTCDWSFDRIDAFEIPRHLFPDVVAPGSRLGGLGAAAAEALGLVAGIPVGLGGGDTQCGLLGTGVVAPGEVGAIAGTTAPIQVVVERAMVAGEGRLWSGHHLIAGRWVVEANGGPMGETLTWIARLLYPESPQPELRLLGEASTADIGSAGMLSTLGAEVMNAREPGLPVGQITLSHMTSASDPRARRHLARAVVEGQAAAMRANLDQLADATGLDLQALHLGGGLSQSDVFATILADLSAREVLPAATAEATALGAALCAGVAAGRYASLEEAAGGATRVRSRLAPAPERAEANARLYAAWSTLREAGQDTTRPAAAAHTMPWALSSAPSPPSEARGAKRGKALVTSAFDDDSLARLRAELDVEYASFRDKLRLLTGPSLVEALAGHEIFVTEIDVVDAESIAQLPELRVIAACRGDAVNIDVEACTAYGIPVLFTPGRNADAVADLAIAFVLSLARKLPGASEFLRDSEVTAGNMGKMGQAFSRFQGNELWRKTVGLVGLGAVGRGVAARLSGFGARVLVADPFVTPERAALSSCELVNLDTLLAESDFVSLHAAVTDETRDLLGPDEFARMKPGAFLINTARAALVDEEALVAALESGHLGGAGLDTFAVEPPGFDHPLVQHAAVIATPHLGGNTVEVAAHQGQIVTDDLSRLLCGERPEWCLNPEVLEHFTFDAPRLEPSAAEIARLGDKAGPAVTDLQRDSKAKKKAAEPETPDSDAATGTAAPQSVVDGMRAILERFCEEMAADAAVIAFSEDKSVNLHFNVTDLGLEFYLALQGGRVGAGVGPAPDGADVELRMRGEILDGMFSGSLNAMEHAMQGDISFTGDAAKAMTIQHLQSDMERVYTRVRDEVGSPGDLAGVPGPDGGGVPTRPVQPGDVREDLVAIVQELYEAQVITATGGNVSVRVPDADDEVWITPSQLFKGDLSPEVLVRIDFEGAPQDVGARSPSSEWSMHTQILRKKPDAKAVIHAHAPNATTLANAGLPFLPISTEAAFFGNIPRVPFIMPGTGELAEAVSDAMKDEWAVLMVNHGLVVCGRSLRRAADMVEIVERTAELILGCYAVGKEPPVLPEEAIKTLRAMGDLVA